MDLDIRTNAIDVETRDEDGKLKIKGYASTYNSPSNPMPFIEYIAPGAFDDVDFSQLLLLYDHDFKNILARVDSDTLSVKPDDKGLYFEATLPDTQLGRDTFTNIVNGNLKGMSFGFDVDEDEWGMKDGQSTRIIHSFKRVVEISITPIPAYDSTSVTTRNRLQAHEDEQQQGQEEKKENQENMNEELKTMLLEIQKRLDEIEAKGEDEPKVDEPKAEDEPKQQEQRDDDDVSDEPIEIDDDKDKKEVEPSEPKEDKEPKETEPVVVVEDDVDDDTTGADDDKDKEEKEEKGGKKEMPITLDNKKSEEQRNFEAFLKGEVRDGFNTVAGEAVIPSQVLDVLKQPNDPAQLASYVNRVQVQAPTGKLPVLKKATARLASAEELAKNPDIASATIAKVAYDVATLRGQLPISFEMVQDYPQIEGLLAQYVQEVQNQTEQEKIGAVLQTATPVKAGSLDDIKTAFNGLINYGADRVVVVTSSMFSALDAMKDGEGRYLIQSDVTAPTGRTLFGAPLVVVADTVLGKAGATVAFIGSLKAFVLEAVKADLTLNWTENEMFEKILAVALRADFQKADDEAGVFVTYKATSPAQA